MSKCAPKGWMNTEETKDKARRGTWACRYRSDDSTPDAMVFNNKKEMLDWVNDGVEDWRYLCLHPDDLDDPVLGEMKS